MKILKLLTIASIFLLLTNCEKADDVKTIFDTDGKDVWVDCTDGRGRTTEVGNIPEEGIDLYSTFGNPLGDSQGYARITYPVSGNYGFLLTKSGGGSFQVYDENMENELFELETGKAIYDEDVEAGTIRMVRCKRGSWLDEFEIRIRLKQP